VIESRYDFGADGASPFESWFAALDAIAAAKVSVALARIEQGNLSNAKGVGGGGRGTGSIEDLAKQAGVELHEAATPPH